MVEEGYDLVIHVNPAPDARLVGRIFLRDRLVVVANPELARPKGSASAAAVVREGATGNASSTWGDEHPIGLDADHCGARAALVLVVHGA